ncbi:MAG: toll/interleukin-1 receptor domain-containing protein [Saprospiraceae bacterium]|nr:toll/interleukin-1 receptor domain-containing protein [Saprospiraceae bacterium]
MAYTLGLPLLILRETSVYQDGLFDDKIETFDQVEIDINNFAELEHKNLKYILKKFFIEVNNVHFPTSKSELDSKSVETGSKKSIKIFISYSSKDRDLMEIITEGIKNHLVETKDYIFDWWDDREIDLGENWKIEIEKRVKESDVSILLISANFVSSQFIKINELGPLFHKYSSGKHLIIPVLARQYQYSQLEELSGLQFFKTYYKDYGFSKPLEKNKLIPFDVLAEDKEPSDLFLNRYFNKLAEKILNSVTNKFK